jgi:multidrug resistance efflux pump
MVLGLAALVVVALGVLYLVDQAAYVGTDNAVVTGTVVQLGSPTNGQIRSIAVEVGDEVQRGQLIATVALASPQNSPQAPVTQASVRSTIDGIIAARHGSPGDSVTAGRAIVSIVDPEGLWIQANIDEAHVGRIRAGNPVDVTIPALGQVLPGHVTSVGPASSSAAAQLSPAGSSASPFRSALTVPVRIELDSWNGPLTLGSSASVRIRVTG